MLTRHESVPDNLAEFRRLLPLSLEEPLTFIDIETLGLDRKRHPIMLIGLMILSPRGNVVTQFFAEHPDEEPLILSALMAALPQAGILVSYNGQAFDIPYINHRLALCGFREKIPAPRNVDLLHLSRKALPGLSTHRLKAVEAALGIYREDTLSGGDCVLEYQRYLREGDPALAHGICLHNYEDILHMAPLLQLYPRLAPESVFRTLPFALRIESQTYWIKTPAVQKSLLTLSGASPAPAKLRQDRHQGSASLSIADHQLQASLPIIPFDYPEPGSLYLDTDGIPGYAPLSFNAQPFEDKRLHLLRSGDRWLPEALALALNRILAI